MESIKNRLVPQHNIGSVRQLIYLPLQFITSGLPYYGIKPSSTGVDTSDLNLNTVTDWFISEFIEGECSWETDQEKSDQGTLYKEKISWTIARDYNNHRTNFDEMEGQEFAVLLIDNNLKGSFFGYQFLDGEKKGMRFSIVKKSTGVRTFDRNQYQLSFYMECYQLPFLGTYTPSGGGGGGGGQN